MNQMKTEKILVEFVVEGNCENQRTTRISEYLRFCFRDIAPTFRIVDYEVKTNGCNCSRL